MGGMRTAGAIRLCTLALLLACACARGEETEPPPEEAPAEAASEDSLAAPADTRVVDIAYVEGAFPHVAHSGVACAVCHGAMPGHATHGETACIDCHIAPESAATERPSPAECTACHHAADRPQPCAHCHASPPAARAVTATLSIADRPAGAARVLMFDHARHADSACRTCHTAATTLAVERACASCHDEHHRPAADCAACHASVPLTAHEASAHRGCDGAGCHRASPTFASPGPRNVCLVCHRAQTDHEPGGECRECHLVAGADS